MQWRIVDSHQRFSLTSVKHFAVRNKEGRIGLDELLKVAMRDPKNIKEFERALDLNIRKQEEIRKANDSALPAWLRFSDSVSKYETAKMELAGLNGAKAELQMYKKELAENNAAHSETAQSKFISGTAPHGPMPGQIPHPSSSRNPVSLQRPPKAPRPNTGPGL